MEKTRLLEVLQTLEKNERREFSRFVRSPFFNSNERLSILVEAIFDDFQHDRQPEKETLFAQIFPAKKYDDAQMRLAMSQLLRLAEQYFVWQETFPKTDAPKTETAQKIRLAAAFRKRNLTRHFEKSVAQARTRLAARPDQPADFHTAAHDLEMEQYQWASSAARTADFNLQEIGDAMDLEFLARRLRLACFAQSHAAIWRANYRPGLLTDALNFVKKNPQLIDYPAIGVFFYGWKALEPDGSEADFRRFKTAIFANADRLPTDELRNLTLLALNFCIKKINAGQPIFAREALDLYQAGLEKELFLEKKILSRFAFANIVAIALRCDEVVWAGDFIQKWQSFLEKKWQQPAAALARARLEFHRQNWSAALVELQSADFKDLLSNLIAKTLQARIFFELDEMETLDSHLATFQLFIRRHPALGYHGQNALDFSRFLKKFMVLRPNDAATRTVLRQQILEKTAVSEREWLLEKLETLTA